MRSIKPGRGPSMMGGVVGIFTIGFGILWTVIASQASGIFALFGVLWTGIAIEIQYIILRMPPARTGTLLMILQIQMRSLTH